VEDNDMNATMPREFAARVAAAAAGVDGVRSALVCSAEGAVLGAAGIAEPAREAALGSFLAARAEALPVDGDLRGMGRQLAGSRFGQLIIGTDHGDAVLYNLTRGAYLSVHIAPGRAASVSAPLATLVKRAAAAPETPSRSSQP
jgi:hypothetical protein